MYLQYILTIYFTYSSLTLLPVSKQLYSWEIVDGFRPETQRGRKGGLKKEEQGDVSCCRLWTPWWAEGTFVSEGQDMRQQEVAHHNMWGKQQGKLQRNSAQNKHGLNSTQWDYTKHHAWTSAVHNTSSGNVSTCSRVFCLILSSLRIIARLYLVNYPTSPNVVSLFWRYGMILNCSPNRLCYRYVKQFLKKKQQNKCISRLKTYTATVSSGNVRIQMHVSNCGSWHLVGMWRF